MIKKLYKAVTPPFIQLGLKNILLRKNGALSGPYKNWSDGCLHAAGYHDTNILERVKQATLQVRDNEKLFIRDGIVFSKPQYSFPALAAILKVALENNQTLTVLDFGGALGSTYFDFKRFYQKKINLQWYIVEQSGFVECGNALFANDELSFYGSIDSLPQKPDVIILSGVLQYLENPYQLLNSLMRLDSPYIVIDRTTFDDTILIDKVLVEHVPHHIYKGSYPFWLLSYDKMKEYVTKQYDLMCEFDGLDGKYSVSGFNVSSKGFFLRRKTV